MTEPEFTSYDRDVLYEQVWAEPVRDLAKRYGVSDVALAKACRRLSVPAAGPRLLGQASGRADAAAAAAAGGARSPARTGEQRPGRDLARRGEGLGPRGAGARGPAPAARARRRRPRGARGGAHLERPRLLRLGGLPRHHRLEGAAPARPARHGRPRPAPGGERRGRRGGLAARVHLGTRGADVRDRGAGGRRARRLRPPGALRTARTQADQRPPPRPAQDLVGRPASAPREGARGVRRRPRARRRAARGDPRRGRAAGAGLARGGASPRRGGRAPAPRAGADRAAHRGGDGVEPGGRAARLRARGACGSWTSTVRLARRMPRGATTSSGCSTTRTPSTRFGTALDRPSDVPGPGPTT